MPFNSIELPLPSGGGKRMHKLIGLGNLHLEDAACLIDFVFDRIGGRDLDIRGDDLRSIRTNADPVPGMGYELIGHSVKVSSFQ